jgi:hypothetical protein
LVYTKKLEAELWHRKKDGFSMNGKRECSNVATAEIDADQVTSD